MNEEQQGKFERDYLAAAAAMNKLTGGLPPLDFEPESVDSARARFPEALRDHFDPMEALHGKVSPPSKNRTNVFDFEEGIRMIVSVDDLHTRKVIHVSGSYTEEGANALLKQAEAAGDKSQVGVMARITLEQKFESFAPGLKLNLLTVTPAGALHFLAEEK